MKKDYRLKTDPIQWHEGMPLAPQHFQLNDHRYQSLLNFHFSNIRPFHWGILELEIDQLALSKGFFKLKKIHGIMPDFTVVHYDDNDSLPKLEISLGELDFKQNTVCPIYLALPVYGPNEPSASGNTPRYLSTAGDLVIDENGSFGELTRVPRLAPNLYLIVGQVPSDKFVSLQIAEIHKEEGQYLQTYYVPAYLTLPQNSFLRKMLQDLAVTIRSKIIYTLERYDPASDHPEQTYTKNILDTLIQATLPFEAVISTENLHPIYMYFGLIELAAKLSKLQLSITNVPSFNSYRHHNIFDSFKVPLDYVNSILTKMYDKVQTRLFQKKRGYFGLMLPKAWHSQTLRLGIKRTPELSQDMIYHWINNALIGTENVIRSIIDRRIIGASRRILPLNERGIINVTKEIVVIDVMMDPEFIHPGELLYIFNPSDKPEERPLDIYHYVTISDL